MVTGIISGLVVAAIVAGLGWLRMEPNRRAIGNRIRRTACRHEWRPLNDADTYAAGLQFISPGGDERCVKCNARRWSRRAS